MSRTNLQKRRLDKGLSQIQLAELANISINSLRSYEHKIRNIEDANIKTLLAISNVLECRIFDLFDDSDLMNLTAANVSSIIEI